MKHIGSTAFIVGLLAVGAGAVVGTVVLASKYLDKPSASASPSPVACSGRHASHQVEIKGNAMVPERTNGKLCDTLTVINKDTSDRLVAFGPHDNHVPYDGVAEKLLATGQAFTITLNQVGTYHFHDHLEDIAQGYFTVSK